MSTSKRSRKSAASSSSPPSLAISILRSQPTMNTGISYYDRVFGSRALLEFIISFIEWEIGFPYHITCKYWFLKITKSSIIQPLIDKHSDFYLFKNARSVTLRFNILVDYIHCGRFPEIRSFYTKVRTLIINIPIIPILNDLRDLFPCNGGQLSFIKADLLDLSRQYNMGDPTMIKNCTSPVEIWNRLVDAVGWDVNYILFQNGTPQDILINNRKAKSIIRPNEHECRNDYKHCTYHSRISPRPPPCRTNRRYCCSYFGHICGDTICLDGYYEYWMATGSMLYYCPRYKETHR